MTRRGKKPDGGLVARFLTPFLVAVALLPPLIALLLVPSFHRIAVRHREMMLRGLVDTVHGVMKYQNSLAEKGVISQKEARRRVIAIVRGLRYGPRKRDYFWIVDTQGVVVEHPYRMDLEGKSNIDMTDAEGKKFILDFIQTATRDGDGIVRYKWQWYDDPNRLEKKIAAVKLFAPWGWIVGTGAYLDDIDAEASILTWRALAAGAIAFLVLAALSFNILRQAKTIKRERREAFAKLSATEEKLRMLIESIPDMILRMRRDGVVLDFKDPLNFKPFFEPGEVLHNKITDVWPAEAAAKTMETIEKAFDSGKPESIVFKTQKAPNIPSEKVSIEVQVVVGNDGEVLAVFRDVTEITAAKPSRRRK